MPTPIYDRCGQESTNEDKPVEKKESKLMIIDNILKSNQNIVLVGEPEVKRDYGCFGSSFSGKLESFTYNIAPKEGIYNPKRLNSLLESLAMQLLIQLESITRFHFNDYPKNDYLCLGSLELDETVAQIKKETTESIEFFDKDASDYFDKTGGKNPISGPSCYLQELHREVRAVLFPDATIAKDILRGTIAKDMLRRNPSIIPCIPIKLLNLYIPEKKKPKRKHWFGRKKIRRIGDLLKL